MSNEAQLAGIEYAGSPGITAHCVSAVQRFVQFGDGIISARILSLESCHCILLSTNYGNLVAIKSGFGSGYHGEGSRGFAYVLKLLEHHGTEIDEIDVPEELSKRVEKSALRLSDIAWLESAMPKRPARWRDYIFDIDADEGNVGTIWKNFPAIIPYKLIDSRIVDLALTFWDDPDAKLIAAYRRLEDTVRQRTEIDGVGAKLFSKAFLSQNPLLKWPYVEEDEQKALGGLFVAAYRAYRNPRIHRETDTDANRLLEEFLLTNHLFQLEKACEDSGG